MTADTERLLARIKWAVLQIKLFEVEFTEIGTHLRHGVISPAAALAWVEEIDGTGWLPPVKEVLEILPDRKQRRS
jgi:hypothetical protein